MKKRKLFEELRSGIQAMEAHLVGKITLREFEVIAIDTKTKRESP